MTTTRLQSIARDVLIVVGVTLIVGLMLGSCWRTHSALAATKRLEHTADSATKAGQQHERRADSLEVLRREDAARGDRLVAKADSLVVVVQQLARRVHAIDSTHVRITTPSDSLHAAHDTVEVVSPEIGEKLTADALAIDTLTSAVVARTAERDKSRLEVSELRSTIASDSVAHVADTQVRAVLTRAVSSARWEGREQGAVLGVMLTALVFVALHL